MKKVIKFLKRFWWAFALVFIAVIWLVKNYISSKRLTRLGDGWVQANLDYQRDLVENAYNRSNVRQIKAEYNGAELEFAMRKKQTEDLKNANDQALADAWNNAFGHTSKSTGN